MKSFLCFALIVAVAFAKLNNYEADAIRDSGASWTVGIHPQFEGKSDFELARMVMRAAPIGRNVAITAEAPLEGLPESFDAREQWGAKCPTIKHIRNQAQCGSCWAFGASEIASDRRCIATGQSMLLSPQWLVSCDKEDAGCNGGYGPYTWDFIQNTGLATDECFPYASGAGSVPACPSTCKDGAKATLYRSKAHRQISGEAAMMNELYTNGPIQAAFIVYRDFYYYTDGVYEHKTGGQMGGHAIRIVGYGVEDGVKFWTVTNSWGEGWGIDGTFKIRRGTDECNIESRDVMVGTF